MAKLKSKSCSTETVPDLSPDVWHALVERAHVEERKRLDPDDVGGILDRIFQLASRLAPETRDPGVELILRVVPQLRMRLTDALGEAWNGPIPEQRGAWLRGRHRTALRALHDLPDQSADNEWLIAQTVEDAAVIDDEREAIAYVRNQLLPFFDGLVAVKDEDVTKGLRACRAKFDQDGLPRKERRGATTNRAGSIAAAVATLAKALGVHVQSKPALQKNIRTRVRISPIVISRLGHRDHVIGRVIGAERRGLSRLSCRSWS
jgi:hypothetical protein